MIQTLEATNLTRLLNHLWQHPEESPSIKDRIKTFDTVDWLLLAAWDAAATFGPASGKLYLSSPRHVTITDSWGKPFLRVVLVSVDETTEQRLLITYLGSDIAIAIEESSPFIPTEHFAHEPQSVLRAMQFIRDHLDSAILKPKNLRDNEILGFALFSGLENDRFRRLAIWFPEIQPYLLEEGT